MFLLIENDKTYYLTKDGKYVVGRHGNIIIKNHSISRKHAEITIENNEAFIRDCDSKYFTKYNGKILLKDEVMRLENGGEIIFGEVKVTLKQIEKCVTCSTGIKNNEEELKTVLKDIGGEYLKDWNDSCTHLTTPEIMITLKVLHAIMDNRKIVTPTFWQTVLQNMRENKPLPDPSEFFPPLGESMIHLNQLKYNPDRQHLFAHKKFAFWKKKRQLSMQTIISKAGGKTLLLPSSKSECTDEILELLDNCIVVDPEDANVEKNVFDILQAYTKKGRRVIPVQEIVLAILQCSCEEHCNPFYNRAKTVFTRDTSRPSTSKVVIAETECFQVESQSGKSCIVPSSFDVENYANSHDEDIKTDILISPSPLEETKDCEITGVIDKGSDFIEIPKRKKLASFFKRPATESIAPPPKKPKEEPGTSKMNPFTSMKSKFNVRGSTSKRSCDLDLTNNPFGQSQLQKHVEKEIKTDDVTIVDGVDINSNDDMTKKRKNEDSADSAVSIKRSKIFYKRNRKFVEIGTINFAELKHSISCGSWVDKTVKEETKPSLSNLDENEQKWCERFNNSVVIVSKNLWRKDKENVAVSSSTQSNIKNFKRFQKVAPLKSGHIIKCSKVVFAGSNLGIDYQNSDDEDNRRM